MSASIGSLVATVPEVLGDMSEAIGDKIRKELPDSDLVRRIFEQRQGPPRCAWGYGEHRAGKLAGQSL